jgi:UDP-N-acetylglucosamine transferase subunit ALG13
MILVTTGSSGAPFERLLTAVADFDGDEELIVQHGPSGIRPPGARCVDFLAFDQLSKLVGRARVVVAHAGVGSILLCVAHGRRPVVVPRLARFGEVVDDHQLFLARRLDAAGAVKCVEDPAELWSVVRSLPEWTSVRQEAGRSPLVDDLKSYLDAILSS